MEERGAENRRQISAEEGEQERDFVTSGAARKNQIASIYLEEKNSFTCSFGGPGGKKWMTQMKNCSVPFQTRKEEKNTNARLKSRLSQQLRRKTFLARKDCP